MPGEFTYTKSSSHTRIDMADKAKLADYLSQRFFGSAEVAYKRETGDHHIDAALSSFITKRTVKFITEHRREVTTTFSGRYAYKNRYLFQTALGYSGTYALQNKRYAFSPTVGLGWILSEKNFLKNVSFVDFLKLKAEGGILHYDNSMSAYRDMDNFTYDASGQVFGPYTTKQWFGTQQSAAVMRTYPGLIGNPDLRLEQRKEFSAGLEAQMLNRKLSFEATYYNYLQDGPVTQAANVLSNILGYGSSANPYINYNQYKYYGLELALGWRDKINGFFYAVNANATVQDSRVVKIDELNYPFDYMKKTGLPVNAIFGLKYAGKFTSGEDVQQSLPQMFGSELQAGDFKYTDMNGDGMIDANDNCMIGNSMPKLFFGLNIRLGYKNFDFSLIATGRAFYDLQLTNSYFWNGWGDNNYSQFIKLMRSCTQLFHNKFPNPSGRKSTKRYCTPFVATKTQSRKK
jgi:hypothetical protein